jgi:hypothetical protein
LHLFWVMNWEILDCKLHFRSPALASPPVLPALWPQALGLCCGSGSCSHPSSSWLSAVQPGSVCLARGGPGASCTAGGSGWCPGGECWSSGGLSSSLRAFFWGTLRLSWPLASLYLHIAPILGRDLPVQKRASLSRPPPSTTSRTGRPPFGGNLGSP